MHDIADFESRGLAGVGVASTEFVQAAAAQARLLGFDPAMVFVAHPIQDRSDDELRALADAARVGNIYVNRNQIGAVVESQPFGGEGLSGTGPKAGGPHYLERFTKAPVPQAGAEDGMTSAAEVTRALAAVPKAKAAVTGARRSRTASPCSEKSRERNSSALSACQKRRAAALAQRLRWSSGS